MNCPELGKILDGDAQRDAVHVAIAPVRADLCLKPGDPIGFIIDGNHEVVGVNAKHIIGIVDPFLTRDVEAGELFWMLLWPNTVSSLRHDWTHFAFREHRQTACQWISDYAKTIGVDVDELMDMASAYLERDEYWIEGGRFENVYLDERFWDYYEIVTGNRVPPGERGSFFACSC